MKLRAILFGVLLALTSPLAALAQCSGQAPAGTFCGNPTGATALPRFAAVPPPAFAPPLTILTTGQSNFVNSPAYPWSPDAKAKIWNFSGVDGNVGTAFVPLSATTVNMPSKIASDIALATGRSVCLINVSFDGQAISHWLPGTPSPDVYQNIMNNMPAALAACGTTKIDAMWWWQIEKNQETVVDPTYPASFSTLMTRFWGNSWFPQNTPVIIQGMVSTADSGGAAPNADLANDMLQSVVNADADKRRFVYTSSLHGLTFWEGPTSPLHMTGLGYFTAGAMSANSYLLGPGRNTLMSVITNPVSGNTVIGNPATSSAKLTFNANAIAAVLPSTGANVQIAGANGQINYLLLDAFGGNNGFTCRRANGTLAAKTTLVADNRICGLGASGYNGIGYTNEIADAAFYSSETWTGSAAGTYFEIRNVIPGTTTTVGTARSSYGRLLVAADQDAATTNVLQNLSTGTSALTSTTHINSGGGQAGFGLGGTNFASFGVPQLQNKAYISTSSTGISGIIMNVGGANPFDVWINGARAGGFTSAGLFTTTNAILTTPNLGTPSTLVATNATGTAAGLTAGNVTTNANLTGDVTSVGNATTLATVNSNVGSFGSATQVAQVTLNAKGLATAAANVTVTPAVGSITGLGTGVGAALAIAVGAAGSPVVLNGALGSPASVGTMPAFTMGGTISGGGNQINNIVIGASTPLAGTFTTLTATANSGSVAASYSATTVLRVVGPNSALGRVAVDSYGTGNLNAGSILSLRRGNGTAAVPTAAQSGDLIGGVTAVGYGTTTYPGNGGSGFLMWASQNASDTVGGAELELVKTPTGTVANTPSLRLLATGMVKFSDAASFSANGAVATVLGSIGPTGSHTTVQKWLTIVDSGGTTLYIPAF